MNDIHDLPEKIKELVGGEPCAVDDIGLSDSTVILFRDKVLKIQRTSEESEEERRMTEWLDGRLPVPKLLCFEQKGGRDYLLMTKLSGKMACDEAFLKNPEELAELLAKGLSMLWEVDITDFPGSCTNRGLADKLRMARYRVEHGLVDMENVQLDTYGENGFQSPEHLLEWLLENQPEEKPVLSHGDFCLPNLFLSEEKNISFLDLGRAGLADKWQDIALCYRSFRDNLGGKYGGKTYGGFYPELLFEKLKIKPDWEKIRYYILLDELF